MVIFLFPHLMMMMETAILIKIPETEMKAVKEEKVMEIKMKTEMKKKIKTEMKIIQQAIEMV